MPAAVEPVQFLEQAHTRLRIEAAGHRDLGADQVGFLLLLPVVLALQDRADRVGDQRPGRSRGAAALLADQEASRRRARGRADDLVALLGTALLADRVQRVALDTCAISWPSTTASWASFSTKASSPELTKMRSSGWANAFGLWSASTRKENDRPGEASEGTGVWPMALMQPLAKGSSQVRSSMRRATRSARGWISMRISSSARSFFSRCSAALRSRSDCRLRALPVRVSPCWAASGCV